MAAQEDYLHWATLSTYNRPNMVRNGRLEMKQQGQTLIESSRKHGAEWTPKTARMREPGFDWECQSQHILGGENAERIRAVDSPRSVIATDQAPDRKTRHCHELVSSSGSQVASKEPLRSQANAELAAGSQDGFNVAPTSNAAQPSVPAKDYTKKYRRPKSETLANWRSEQDRRERRRLNNMLSQRRHRAKRHADAQR